MTEGEWSKATDPSPMLDALQDMASDRKLRLFAVACCRRVWDLLMDVRVRDGVDTAERYADGGRLDEIRQANARCTGAHEDAAGESDSAAFGMTKYAAAVAGLRATQVPMDLAAARDASRHARLAQSLHVFETHPETAIPYPPEPADGTPHARLVRCLFGNPFRPVAFDPRWRSADVVGLAQGIYQDRAFDRLLLLADALMDAGCDDEQVLGHCRSAGPHARGCWVVDLVLGRE